MDSRRLAEGGEWDLLRLRDVRLKLTEHTMVRPLDQVYTRAKSSVIINQ